jgi:hypothetical protein
MPGLLRCCHQIGVAIFLEECRAFDLTPQQFGVLAVLRPGAETVADDAVWSSAGILSRFDALHTSK